MHENLVDSQEDSFTNTAYLVGLDDLRDFLKDGDCFKYLYGKSLYSRKGNFFMDPIMRKLLFDPNFEGIMNEKKKQIQIR